MIKLGHFEKQKNRNIKTIIDLKKIHQNFQTIKDCDKKEDVKKMIIKLTVDNYDGEM